MMTHSFLTIEDQSDIRQLIRMTLEFEDFEVFEASRAEQGLEVARSTRPDVILLDVMMPGLDGLEVSRRLAADPQLKHIPVVMLSAIAQSSAVDAGLKTGARAYLTKPFSPMQLLALVNQLVDRSLDSVESQSISN